MIHRCWLLSLAVVLLAGGAAANTYVSMFATSDEITIWRDRAVNGPYKTAGDYATGTPGDWDRIKSYADGLVANQAVQRWDGKSGTGCMTPEDADRPATDSLVHVVDAAFVWQVWNGASSGEQTAALGRLASAYLTPAKAELLHLAGLANLDFTNSTKYQYSSTCLTAAGTADQKLTTWIGRAAVAYDIVRGQMSAGEQSTMETWLTGAYTLMRSGYEPLTLTRWPNRASDDYASSPQAQGGCANNIMYFGGPCRYVWQAPWNNLAFNHAYVAGLIAVVLDDTAKKTEAKRFGKEWIRYMTYADGSHGELDRWTSSLPQQGMSYWGGTLDAYTLIADALCRAGDCELYTYSTTVGDPYNVTCPSGGCTTPKTFLGVATRHLNYKSSFTGTTFLASQKVTRYASTTATTDELKKIDSFPADNNNRTKVSEVYLARANLYYKSDYLKAHYLRTHGLPPHNDPPNGGALYWGGNADGIMPGVLFMSGQMEDLVNPYATGADTTPPTAPTGLSVTAIYPTQIQVSWTPSVSGDVDHHEVRMCTGLSCTPTTTIHLDATSPWVWTGATPDTTYWIGVVAVDTSQNASDADDAKQTAETPQPGLIAHWDMDSLTSNTITDVSVNTHDGTVFEGATPGSGPTLNTSTPMVGTGSLTFPGSDDYVEIADHAALNFLAEQDFTITMWVRSSQSAAADVWPQLLNKVANTPDDGLEMGLHDSNTGTWYGGLWVNGGAFVVGNQAGNTCTTAATGTSRHLAWKREGTTLTAYQNGQPCDTLTQANISASVSNTIPLRLGIWADESSYDYAGDLDEVRLYNSALTDAAIGQLASPGTTVTVTHLRWGVPGHAEGSSRWIAAEDAVSEIRVNGSARLRFQLSVSGADSNQGFPLQCRVGASSFATVTDSCFSFDVCIAADSMVNTGDATTARQLTLPGGSPDYVAGQYVTNTAWPTWTVPSGDITEVEYNLRLSSDIPPQTTLDCRPVAGNGAALDYTALPLGAARATVTSGAASLWGG